MILAAVAAGTVGTAGAAPRPLHLGIETPLWQTAELPFDYQRAFDTKVEYVRIVVDWSGIEPSKNSFSWTKLDSRIDQAISKGLKPFVTVRKAPVWAERCTFGTDGTCDPDPVAFGALGAALVARYENRLGMGVHAWEVWNEPNLTSFLNPQQKNGSWYSPIIYRQLVNNFADAVHADDPTATIVAGATAPYRRKLSQPGPLRFMRRMLCLSDTNQKVCSTKSHFDAWSTHPYTSGGPTHHAASSGDVSLGDLPKMKRVLNAALNAGNIVHSRPVEFWVGEFSWDSNAPDPKAVPMTLLSRWVSEALYRSWRAGATTFIWFTVRDRSMNDFAIAQAGFWFCGAASRTDDGSCGDPGFDYTKDVRKPSWRAYYFPFVAFANNGRINIWAHLPGAQQNKLVMIQRRTSSGWKTIKTATSNSVGIAMKTWSSTLRTGSLRAKLGSGEVSLGFSLVRPRDRIVQPFGCGGNVPC